MGTVETRQLRRVHAQVRRAEKDLCSVTRNKVVRLDGSTTWHAAPSLLNQLRGAVGNSGNRGTAARSMRPTVVNVDALDLLTDITHGAYFMGQVSGDIENCLRHAIRWATGQTDPDPAQWITAHLIRWAASITELLNPLRRFHVAAPCPECGTRMVWHTDPRTGDVVQVPALHVDSVSGCTCLHCGTEWPVTHLEHLAAVLGCVPLPI